MWNLLQGESRWKPHLRKKRKRPEDAGKAYYRSVSPYVYIFLVFLLALSGVNLDRPISSRLSRGAFNRNKGDFLCVRCVCRIQFLDSYNLICRKRWLDADLVNGDAVEYQRPKDMLLSYAGCWNWPYISLKAHVNTPWPPSIGRESGHMYGISWVVKFRTQIWGNVCWPATAEEVT